MTPLLDKEPYGSIAGGTHHNLSEVPHGFKLRNISLCPQASTATFQSCLYPCDACALRAHHLMGSPGPLTTGGGTCLSDFKNPPNFSNDCPISPVRNPIRLDEREPLSPPNNPRSRSLDLNTSKCVCVLFCVLFFNVFSECLGL